MWPLIGDLLPHAPHGGEVGGNDWSVQSSRHWRRPLEDIPSLALSWRPHCMRSNPVSTRDHWPMFQMKQMLRVLSHQPIFFWVMLVGSMRGQPLPQWHLAVTKLSALQCDSRSWTNSGKFGPVTISGTYLHGVVLRGNVTFGRAQLSLCRTTSNLG